MKKFKNLFAIVLALVLCLGAMTACSGEKPEDTKKPSSSTSGDKNESKPSQTKPTETKPTEDTNQEATQPSSGNNATTDTQPEGGESDTTPEGDADAQG